MAYFDATGGFDIALLHDDVQTHSEAQAVADEVERDIVDYFTETGEPALTVRNQTLGVTLFWYIENSILYTVHLWGYNSDETEAAGYDADRGSWTGFAKAFRECIAHVTSHRLRHYDEALGIESESIGRRSWDYSSRDLRWPRNWKRRLKKYSTKAPVYGI